MEEADGILILALKQVGVGVPKSLVSIREFDSDLIVEAASLCIRAIVALQDGEPVENYEKQFPKSLPPNMAGRHRLCTKYGKKLKVRSSVRDRFSSLFVYFIIGIYFPP